MLTMIPAEIKAEAVESLALFLGMAAVPGFVATPEQRSCYTEAVATLAVAAGALDALKAFDTPEAQALVERVVETFTITDDQFDQAIRDVCNHVLAQCPAAAAGNTADTEPPA